MCKYGANLQACRIKAGYNSARDFCEKITIQLQNIKTMNTILAESP